MDEGVDCGGGWGGCCIKGGSCIPGGNAKGGGTPPGNKFCKLANGLGGTAPPKICIYHYHSRSVFY